MSAVFLEPTKTDLTTTLQDLTTPTPTGKVRTFNVRYANVGADAAYGDLVLTDGTVIITRAKNYPVPYQKAGSAPDMEEGIVVPAGWKLQGKASAGLVVQASISNGIEADTTDFA